MLSSRILTRNTGIFAFFLLACLVGAVWLVVEVVPGRPELTPNIEQPPAPSSSAPAAAKPAHPARRSKSPAVVSRKTCNFLADQITLRYRIVTHIEPNAHYAAELGDVLDLYTDTRCDEFVNDGKWEDAVVVTRMGLISEAAAAHRERFGIAEHSPRWKELFAKGAKTFEIRSPSIFCREVGTGAPELEPVCRRRMGPASKTVEKAPQ